MKEIITVALYMACLMAVSAQANAQSNTNSGAQVSISTNKYEPIPEPPRYNPYLISKVHAVTYSVYDAYEKKLNYEGLTSDEMRQLMQKNFASNAYSTWQVAPQRTGFNIFAPMKLEYCTDSQRQMATQPQVSNVECSDVGMTISVKARTKGFTTASAFFIQNATK